MPPRAFPVFAILLATALSTPARPAHAQVAGDDRHSACAEVAQRYRTGQTQINPRTLNFLLFDAAELGCLELAKEFQAAGALLSARDRFGNTALLIAARSGETEVVEHLLAEGSAVDHANLAGNTALLHAVKANRRKTAQILLKAGADPAGANTKGVTPLAAAAFNGNRRLLRLLLKAGADPRVRDATGKAPLVYAAGKGFTQIVEDLLAAGAPVDGRDDHDLTALMWAAGHSNDVPATEGLATVTLLLERGARLNLTDDRGRGALMIAAARGHEEIVGYLLARGADSEKRDKAGKTAFDLAVNEAARQALARP